MLLERPSELVTREEMRQRLWGEDTFVDFDHGLNTAVNKLREALGDLASQPRHVETVLGQRLSFHNASDARGPGCENVRGAGHRAGRGGCAGCKRWTCPCGR